MESYSRWTSNEDIARFGIHHDGQNEDEETRCYKNTADLQRYILDGMNRNHRY